MPGATIDPQLPLSHAVLPGPHPGEDAGSDDAAGSPMAPPSGDRAAPPHAAAPLPATPANSSGSSSARAADTWLWEAPNAAALRAPLLAGAPVPRPDAPGRLHGFTLRGASLMLGASTALAAAHFAQAITEVRNAAHPNNISGVFAPLHGLAAGSTLGMATSYAILVAQLARHRAVAGDFTPTEYDARMLDLEAGGSGTHAEAAAWLAHVHERRVAAVALLASAAAGGAGLIADLAGDPRLAHPCGDAAPGTSGPVCRPAAVLAIGIGAGLITALSTAVLWIWGIGAARLLAVQARSVLAPRPAPGAGAA